MIRHGTVPSGFELPIVVVADHTSSSSSWHSMRFSAITMRTLRTYGLERDPIRRRVFKIFGEGGTPCFLAL
jgi:hypothetical protein